MLRSAADRAVSPASSFHLLGGLSKAAGVRRNISQARLLKNERNFTDGLIEILKRENKRRQIRYHDP